MTIRRRIKKKWHLTLGDFEFKRASYNPNGSKTFEVWYKNDFIGDCKVTHSYYGKITAEELQTIPAYIPRIKGICSLRIDERIPKDLPSNDSLPSDKVPTRPIHMLGNLYCTGQKNGFPSRIVYVELFPSTMNNVAKREMLFEKYRFFKTLSIK